MVTQTNDPLVGKLLSGCRLTEKIGQGGMGTVYLAHHIGLDKKVAVKIMPPSFSHDEERVKRFIREARATAKLEHPNIVQVYDIRIAKPEGFYFIVMQYVEGENMDWTIKRRGKLPIAEATRIIRDAAVGLAAAHSDGIIHRDVKPENIMLTHAGQVKLMDFGLSRMGNSLSSISSSGDILGTPHYMSPEQARGETVDARTDIYALGVTYYYALTGRKPFDGTTPVTVIMKHLNEPPPDPRTITPEIPPELAGILLKMLAKDTHKRYQSARELIPDLERILAAMPRPVLPVASKEPLSSGKDSSADTGTARTIKVAAVKTGMSTRPVRTAQAHSSSGENATKGTSNGARRKLLIAGAAALCAVGIMIGLGIYQQKAAEKPNPTLPDNPVAPVNPPPVVPPPKQPTAAEALSQAQAYLTKHPINYIENISHFRTILNNYPDTPEAKTAQTTLHSLKLGGELKLRCSNFCTELIGGKKELTDYFDPNLPNRKQLAGNYRLARIVLFGNKDITFVIDDITVQQEENNVSAVVKLTWQVKAQNEKTTTTTNTKDEQSWKYYQNRWYFVPSDTPNIPPRHPNRDKPGK